MKNCFLTTIFTTFIGGANLAPPRYFWVGIISGTWRVKSFLGETELPQVTEKENLSLKEELK